MYCDADCCHACPTIHAFIHPAIQSSTQLARYSLHLKTSKSTRIPTVGLHSVHSCNHRRIHDATKPPTFPITPSPAGTAYLPTVLPVTHATNLSVSTAARERLLFSLVRATSVQGMKSPCALQMLKVDGFFASCRQTHSILSNLCNIY